MAVTLSKYGSSINRLLCHLVGLSTDTKPIGTYTDKSGKVFLLENGSSFEEMDTDKKYLYDAENQTWNLAASGGGGGGSTLIEKSITANGEYNASEDSADGYSKVTVDVAGGGGSLSNAVNFYDYDGTIVQSYSADDFANLSELPENPSHEGLTAQGWSWSLADAKAYVADYGKLNIGQMYVTSDGKTRVHINLIDNYTSPTLELYLEANSEVDIDWGDGSTHSTFTSTTAGYVSELHSYSTSGDYTIIINVISGDIRPNGNGQPLLKGSNTETNRIYRESLYNIEIGNSITSIGTYAFSGCSSLTSITIPNGVTSIGTYAFSHCNSLTSVTIPNSVTSIGTSDFNGCYSLTSITIPNSVTSIDDIAFNDCYSLTSITIPNGVTSIGNSTFSGCYSLLNIYVANTSIPSGSPWGAPNSHVNVIATRHNNYQSSCTEVASGTTLTGTVNATVGDLVVATFVIRGNTYTFDSGWTLLGISEVVSTSNQRTAMAYKTATSSSESLTVTQDTAGRIYINLVSITGASVGTFSGFTTQATGKSITMSKPQGLVVWGISSSLWGTQTPYEPWEISDTNNITAIQLPTSTQPRCLTALDQSNNANETFRYSPDVTGDAGLAAASLTITGIDNFWYYDD